jgi:hypothetical protein
MKGNTLAALLSLAISAIVAVVYFIVVIDDDNQGTIAHPELRMEQLIGDIKHEIQKLRVVQQVQPQAQEYIQGE